MTMASAWEWFYAGFLFLALANVALDGVNLLYPHWTRRRATVRLLSDLTGSALVVWLLNANMIDSVVVAGVADARTIEVVRAVHRVMRQVTPIVIIAGAVIAGFDIYRIVRVSGGEERSTLKAGAASL
jgi:hypothetical protein